MANYGVSWHITHLLGEYYSHICSTGMHTVSTLSTKLSQNPKIAVFATVQCLLAGHIKPYRSVLTVNSPVDSYLVSL